MRQMAEIAPRAAADSLADCVDCAYAVLTHAAWEESKKGRRGKGEGGVEMRGVKRRWIIENLPPPVPKYSKKRTAAQPDATRI